MKRTLSLKRETLAELSPSDLRNVAGAALPTLPLNYCIGEQNTKVVCVTGDYSRCACITEA